jgi:hypothetical protein
VGEERPPEEVEGNRKDAPGEAGGVSRIREPRAGPVVKPQEPPSKPVDQRREGARQWIAFVLLAILIAQLAFFAYTVFGTDTEWERAQEFMQVTLSGTLALLGSVIGFYYGSQK